MSLVTHDDNWLASSVAGRRGGEWCIPQRRVDCEPRPALECGLTKVRRTLRSMAMKGIVACTARNHSGLNLRTCTRAAPDGALAKPAVQKRMQIRQLTLDAIV
jgi:hypothetical protein